MSRTPATNHPAFARARTSVRVAIGALLACAAGALPAVSSAAVPVIPGAAGYGITTAAGRAGTVHRVTNLNASGAGSLKACVDASGPRACVFEVSGTIRLSADLVIRNPYITIAGQTAPSPGILLRGAGLWVTTSHVLVQHLRVRPGDDPTGPTPENRDALKISAPQSTPLANVVIDHCSFSWSVDEIASVMNAWDNVTLSNNIFAEPLVDSIHPDGNHGYGVLLENRYGTAHATLTGNLFVSNRDRNPHSRAQHLVYANNVVYNPGGIIKLQAMGVRVTQNTLIGNVFIPGPDSIGAKPIQIRAEGDDALQSGSKVYLADNVSPDGTTDPWSIAGPYTTGGDPTKYRTGAPPTWPASLTRLPAKDNVAKNSVLKDAGARPADRDAVDRRIVEGVTNATGTTINCVAPNGTSRCQRNGGGWPTLPSNKRVLTLPADPNTVTASGYTNLELWLHKMSAEVEGRSPHTPNSPKLASGT